MGEMEATEAEEKLQLQRRIGRILEEAKASNATHLRKLKDLSALLRSKASSSPSQFVAAFSRTLTPLFTVQCRTASAERVVRFVSAFATIRDTPSNASHCWDEFLGEFLKFLLVAAAAANKTARFRACQIISEIIMRLPDDAEVSNELWDEVIECMKIRVGDKVPVIRTFAVRALSRFVNDAENSDILDLFLEVLPLEQNAEVRKTILLALPPSQATSKAIIDCTLDVSELVRKAAYCVLANKFPLQSFSIKHRTVILQRGLADRSVAVSKECLKLMKEEWLNRCCNGDAVVLLKYLDVETYEFVGESVMMALLKDGSVTLQNGQHIHEYILSSSGRDEGIQLLEPEFALYWKTVCRHLQTEAQAKGSDAAVKVGAEAVVFAAEASDTNDLVERILPATVSDYVGLVKAHIAAGPNYHFASRQLLLLGAMLDFSDSTSRKVASTFVQELLHKPLDHEVDDEGNKVVIGDGINLGGDKDWAEAVSTLARKVHAATGEFEEVILSVIEELARPCRERTADFLQWMHCLAVAGLLFEGAKAFIWLPGKAIEPVEVLQSLLLPGAKHVHLDVQRVAIRCLGLYGLMEKQPSEEVVKQLMLSFVKGHAPISIMACKALVDLGMWHRPEEVNRALGLDHFSKFQDGEVAFNPIEFSNADEVLSNDWLGILNSVLDRNGWGKSVEGDESETIQAVVAEGFAKILLLSDYYPCIQTSTHSLLLTKLISLYFSGETKDLRRLKQCLSVFFEHYSSLSLDHKKCLSKAFIPVMRSLWPGICGNAGGSSFLVSNLRKRAVQASRFMLQMMQAPLYPKHTEIEDENRSTEFPAVDNSVQPSLECGEEGLALRIAAEVVSFKGKKTPAERTFASALCRILVLLQFRISEQGAIKLMRKLVNHVAETVSVEKGLVKELKQMAERLKSVDSQPDDEMPPLQADLILGTLEIQVNLDADDSGSIPQTPLQPPRSTRPSHSRRRVRPEDESSSDEEISATAVVPTSHRAISVRSQRASKTAALTKMTASKAAGIDDFDDDDDDEEDDEEEDSEVTAEEDSDGSEHFT